MTSMQFNTIGQQQNIAQQSKPLTLREGQVFHGSIKQLFPDQIAEVQVGAHKLVAKLETPLKAGDSHYFQVTNTNGQIELKVVTGPMAQATPAQQMTQLMDTMNLPKSTEMRQVLTHFINNNIPMSKEQLLQAEAWIKAMPDNASKQVALQAMTRMIDLKMPFTNDVFQALLNGSKPAGMADSLATLLQRLGQDTQINPALKNSIQQQIQTIQQPLQQQVGGNILALAVSTIQDPSATMANKLEALSLLKQAGTVGQQASLSNLVSTAANASSVTQSIGQLVAQLANSTPQNAGQIVSTLQNAIAQDTTLTVEQKTQLQQQIERFVQTPKSTESMNPFAKQLGEQLLKFHASNQLANPMITNDQGLTSKDQLLSLLKPDHSSNAPLTQLVQQASQSQSSFIQSLVTNAEMTVQANMDSKQIEQAMKTVLRSLGLNYETMLGSGKADQIESVTQSLKPQLMNLLNDVQISVPVREAAEGLLARLNGMQLLSTDNGHQHQIVMQVPLEFLGKRMEATLHWNGRMKEDGKIDSNYARVLFYLQMESIQETVIDMHVQNRVVSVTVFNEQTNLQPLANGLKELLSIGLEEKGYQLSGVQIKPFEQQVVSTKKEESPKDTPRTGVDIRI